MENNEVKLDRRMEERHASYVVRGGPIMYDEKHGIRLRIDNAAFTWRDGLIAHVTLAGRLVDSNGQLIGREVREDTEWRRNLYLMWDREWTHVPVPDWFRPALATEGVELP